MKQKLDAAANAMVILVGLVMVCVFVRNYGFWGRVTSPSEHEIQPGTQLTIRGVDWNRSDRTLVLALRKGCRYCEESMAFYRQLVGMQRAGQFKADIVAVLPNDANSAHDFMESSGLSVTTVPKTPLESIQVQGTPTVILVDRGGHVVRSWVGVLSEGRKQEIVKSLKMALRT